MTKGRTIHHLNPQTRKEVWNALYRCDFAFRYYQALSNSLLKKHKRLSLWTKVLGGGTVLPAIVQLHSVLTNEQGTAIVPIALGTLGILVVIVSEIAGYGDFARKASVCASISKSCGMLAQEFADLLSALDQRSISDEEARRELKRLKIMVAQETDGSEKAGIVLPNPNDQDETLDQATEDACRYMEALYVN